MTRIVIDKENEITKLKNMLENLTDEKDKQSVRFAINVISGFNEVLSERPQGEWIVTAEDNDGIHRICCPFCSYEKGSNSTDPIIVTFSNFPKFCENCGADMRGGAE